MAQVVQVDQDQRVWVDLPPGEHVVVLPLDDLESTSVVLPMEEVALAARALTAALAALDAANTHSESDKAALDIIQAQHAASQRHVRVLRRVVFGLSVLSGILLSVVIAL